MEEVRGLDSGPVLKVTVMQFPHGIVMRYEGWGPHLGLHRFYGQWLLSTGSLALERRAPSFRPPFTPSSRERDAGRCGVVDVQREMSRHSLVTPKQRRAPTFIHSKSPSFR